MVTINRRQLTAPELREVQSLAPARLARIAKLLAPPVRPSAEELSRPRFFPSRVKP